MFHYDQIRLFLSQKLSIAIYIYKLHVIVIDQLQIYVTDIYTSYIT